MATLGSTLLAAASALLLAGSVQGYGLLALKHMNFTAGRAESFCANRVSSLSMLRRRVGACMLLFQHRLYFRPDVFADYKWTWKSTAPSIGPRPPQDEPETDYAAFPFLQPVLHADFRAMFWSWNAQVLVGQFSARIPVVTDGRARLLRLLDLDRLRNASLTVSVVFSCWDSERCVLRCSQSPAGFVCAPPPCPHCSSAPAANASDCIPKAETAGRARDAAAWTAIALGSAAAVGALLVGLRHLRARARERTEMASAILDRASQVSESDEQQFDLQMQEVPAVDDSDH